VRGQWERDLKALHLARAARRKGGGKPGAGSFAETTAQLLARYGGGGGGGGGGGKGKGGGGGGGGGKGKGGKGGGKGSGSGKSGWRQGRGMRRRHAPGTATAATATAAGTPPLATSGASSAVGRGGSAVPAWLNVAGGHVTELAESGPLLVR
jgi:hypothetical protein